MMLKKLFLMAFALGMCCMQLMAKAPELENIGRPLKGKGINFFGKSISGDETLLWAIVSSSNKFGLLSINAITGKSQWYSLKKYGPPKIQAAFGADKNIYILCGRPETHFLKFTISSKTFTDLGVPAEKCYYFLYSLLTPDGKFVVGTYPEAKLVWVDTKTGKIDSSERLDNNPKNKYILTLKQDKSGTIYSATGLNSKSVWAYDLKSRKKKQILDSKFLKQNGQVKLYKGVDGNIYGRDYKINYNFLCTPNGAKKVTSFKEETTPDLMLGKFKVVELDKNGKLVLFDSKNNDTKLVQTNFLPDSPLIYSICGGIDGKVWVGGFQPANIAALILGENKVINFGQKVKGKIQVYSMLETPKGLFATSYTSGSVNLIDAQNVNKKSKFLISLDKKYKQERIFTLVKAKDGMIYGPTMPVKGILGGGILRINPETLKCSFFRNVVPQQSLRWLCALPDGMLLGGSDINGGTSAIPTAKEAYIFIWDPKSRKVIWKATPEPGETCYPSGCRIGENLYCIISSRKRCCIILDTQKRKVLNSIHRKGGMRLAGAAPDKLSKKVYILSVDSLLELNVETKQWKTLLSNSKVIYDKFHKALHSTHAEWVSPDGVLYLGSGSSLYKLDLKQYQEQGI